MPKLISLVIPTRNRPACLLDSLAIALALREHLEIVVVDNSDTPDLRDALAASIATGDVRYDYSDEPLSVVGNFERALDFVTGDYVMFIGDDDAIGPGLVDIARWARHQGIDAVVSYRSRFIANYFWPGVQSRYFGDAYSASLFVHPFTGTAERLDVMTALRQVAAEFGGGLGSLPRAYHGLVSRRLLMDVRHQHGCVFGGVSPDIFSATLISASCRNAWAVDYPFVIPGASPASTAGQGAARTDTGQLKQTEHITRFGKSLQWDPRIPAFYAPQNVWAISLQMALDRVPELGIRPSWGRLYGRDLLAHRRHWREVLAARRQLAQDVGPIRASAALVGGLLTEIGHQAMRVLRRLRHPRAGGGARRLAGLSHIRDAYAALNLIAQGVPTPAIESNQRPLQADANQQP